MKFSLYKKAFTLIELLVVVAIIGLLTSIVMVSLNSARQKGSIASGLTFSDHTRSALSSSGSNLAPIVYFDFNNAGVSSGIIQNLGTASGSVVTFNSTGAKDTTLHNSGGNLQTTNQYPFYWQETGSSISNAISSLNFTMALWFNSGSSTVCANQCGIISNTYGNGGSGYTDIRFNHSNLEVLIENTVVISYVPNLQVNTWYHLAASVANKGTNTKIAFYINGQQVASNSVSTASLNISAPSSGISLGGACCVNNYAVNVGALFDDVAFYDSTLIASKIENIYALEKYKFLAIR